MNVMLRLLSAALLLPAVAAAADPSRPNMLVILADDLGFSDLGCYGGEIDTPHLDALAAGGLRFTQGYQTARCWPSRAAILTGYYPQAVNRDTLPGAEGGVVGTRPAWARLLPELLAPAGYRSYHSGKWHVDGDPRAQGFARSLFVDAAAQSNYFTMESVTEDGRPVPETADSYVTAVIGDHAVRCLRDHAAAHAGTPFFHYVAFTSPHFPLHAPAGLIAKYRDRYRAGWDAVRAARVARLAKAQIVTTPAGEMERGVGLPYPMNDMRERFGPHEVDRPVAWAELTGAQQTFQADKMAIHAAMVEAMDREVGRIVAELKAAGLFDKTFILFASDNGASAEMLIRGEGHDLAAAPGSRKTFLCLGPGWSSCANTPFRRHKMWTHEGGIATPWIVHWPQGHVDGGDLRRQPVHLIDVAPTVLEIAGVAPPAIRAGLPVPPMHGRSFVKPLRDPDAPPIHDALWWCHDGHRAVREGDWKLVADRGQAWELYDLARDRCETTNVAAAHPDRVRALEARWTTIAGECRSLTATRSRRPNIVWLLAEDMSPWIKAYGDATVPTPHLDRLAREGVVYDHAFATSPVCAPARSSLITGMFCTRIGTMHMRNSGPHKDAVARGPDADAAIPAYEGLPPPFVRCFPETLRAAGYSCTNNDKKDYQFREPVTVWDESSGHAHWRNRADGQPFFAVFNYGGTHESRAFPDAKRSPPVVAAEAVPLPPFYPDTPRVREAVARTYDNIAALDAWVGERIGELESAGLLDETVVMFFSDHGVGLPRGKRSCFDTGLRVPLIVRHPAGAAAGTREGRVVSFVDFGPTVLSLAGIEPDARLDGTPFLGRFARERDDERRGHAYANADRFDTVYDRARTVSDGRYRYTRNFVPQSPTILRNAYREQLPMTADLYRLQETGPERPEQWQVAARQRPVEEFYDSQADPWEVDNLIAAPEHRERIARLRQHLDAWIAATGDLGFVLPETRLVREAIWPPDGTQPTTPVADIVDRAVQRGDSMAFVVSITCADPGASIGYRLGTDRRFAGPWQVYGGPFEVPANRRFLEVQTHRIGHKPATTGAFLGGE